MGSSISKISTIPPTEVRACLVLAATKQSSEEYPNSMAGTLDHTGLNTCQTLSCGEDIIIVKCDLIYLTVKGVLEKEDSYDDMHGLSHPSHANDEADQSNNVGNFHLEILKHE